MRDYGKVYATFWSSGTTSTLSTDGKLLALYLMTCSHATIAGVFRLPDGYVAEDLNWDASRVSEGFDELLSKGFADRCATTKWVWIRKHLEWNKPENPNQRKSAAKIAFSVPDECSWKVDFIEDSAEQLGIELPPKTNPSVTVKEPFPNQEQKQEQKQEMYAPVFNGCESAGAEPPVKTISTKALIAEGVDKQQAGDWLTLRKAKRLPLTPTAWGDTKAEGAKVGLTPAETVAHAVRSNWAGFKASWYLKDAQQAPASSSSSALAGAI